MIRLLAKRTAALTVFALLLPAQAVAPADLPALAKLEPGKWELTNPASPGAKPDFVCLGDPIRLMKVEHNGLSCPHEVVESGPNGGSIHYVCAGNGFGRTTVRVETPRRVKIDSQGMASNRPFAYKLQARRVGPC